MFDKKTVDAYKQITAPDELKEKVMAACFVDKAPEKRNFFGTMRMYATLAACFVLVIVFSVLPSGISAIFRFLSMERRLLPSLWYCPIRKSSLLRIPPNRELFAGRVFRWRSKSAAKRRYPFPMG